MTDPKEYTLNSGGAKGSDSYFDEIARFFGVTNLNHFYFGKKTPIGNVEITQEQLEEGWQEVLRANKILKRWGIHKYKNLLARNWFQVKNSDAVYAITSIIDNMAQGGTAYAIAMSVINNKPCFVYDQNVQKWFLATKNPDKDEFIFTETDLPVLSKLFGGIGTREINDYGKKAILNLFQKTFGVI